MQSDMNKNTGRFCKTLAGRTWFFALLFCSGIFLFLSCGKDDEKEVNPTLSFVVSPGYLSHDSTLAVGASVNVGILAEKGSANLTNFIIKVNNEVYLDSGMNTASMNFVRKISKGLDSLETWTFIIRDKNGNSASVSFNLLKSQTSAFGEVNEYQSLLLGAQNNTSTGSFFSFISKKVYTLSEAFQKQDSIDLVYYYGSEGNTIASPGANIETGVFTGSAALENWSVRRTTRFKTAGFTQTEFETMANDSLLIASYGISEGNRKAKYLTSGNIYVFKTQSGKYGVFLVKTVNGTADGNIEIAVKIQK